MPKVLNLKRKKIFRVGRREIIVIIVSIILTSVGIKASDTIFGPEAGESKSTGPCPIGMALVPSEYGGFCIDLYEASPGEECVYSDPQNQAETRLNLDIAECKPVSQAGARPWRLISQDQAAFACAKAGKRLPTNKEWLQAALGTPDSESEWNKNDCQVNSNWEDQPGLTGSSKNCQSSAGAFDMIGNVWEWVQGAVNDGYYNNTMMPESGYIDSLDGESMPGETNVSNPNQNYKEDYFWLKSKGLRGMARGGYWNNKEKAGQYSIYAVTPPSSAEVGIGFRCVK